jgi:hypothetical protein
MGTASQNSTQFVRHSHQTSTKHKTSTSSLDKCRFYRQMTPVSFVLQLYFLETKQLSVFRYLAHKRSDPNGFST